MRTIAVQSFDDWRPIARQLLLARIQPSEVLFHDQTAQRGLFDQDAPPVVEQPLSNTFLAGNDDSIKSAFESPRVPREFLELARSVACHRDSDRFQLLYRVLWRLTSSEPQLMKRITDDDVHRLTQMEKAIRRDAHKMKAFVRFRKMETPDGEQFVAWHRPDHRIVRLVAPFFSRRFPTMTWAILTSDESAFWDQTELRYGPGHSRSDAPQGDELEDLWRTYYGSIFNPARIKLKAMTREMPVRHWATLPEAQIIDELLDDAPRRVAEMIAHQEGHNRSAADHIPSPLSWETISLAARHCHGCDLHQNATQIVFGEGPRNARIAIVGEQPGDQEDTAGRPFIGPAGQVLDDALAKAGLARANIYVTNAVKHFKFDVKGTKRIHQKPSSREIRACRPWVDAELSLIQPQILICLGATAAQSLIGPGFSIGKMRGKFLSSPYCESTIATYHPSAVLRSLHPETIRSLLIEDLKIVKFHLDQLEERSE